MTSHHNTRKTLKKNISNFDRYNKNNCIIQNITEAMLK